MISIGLLLILMLNNTEFHQLMKLPVLVNHYFDHKQLNHSLSFVDFIFIHYSDDLESNDQTHHELPFKSHECQHMTSLVLVCEFPSYTPLKIANGPLVLATYQESIYASNSLGAIWQPPQII